ncbi:hypothetical protein UT300005_25030 [Clostridium sp. CTA-5]
MIIWPDKEKIMNEFNLKYVDGRFDKESTNIHEEFNKNKLNITETLISKFKEICKKANKLQEQGLKGKIKFIYISYLRTSLIENTGIWRIDLYDEKWFLDKEECAENIDLTFIYNPLFNHMQELLEKRKEYGRTITEMDIEKIKLIEGDKYHNLAIKILQNMIENFLECSEYKDMKNHEELMIFAGEYRDNTVLLYERSTEK